MALGRPHILMPHHLAGHSHGHPAVDHRLNKEAAELSGLDGPADGRYAGLLEDEPEPAGRYLVGSPGGARIPEDLVRLRHPWPLM